MSGGPYGRGKAPERECLKLAAWPEIDRRLWKRALAPADLLEDTGGERARFREHSNCKAESGYGRWLTFLEGGGWLDGETSPGARITPDRVKAYVTELQDLDNKQNTILSRLQELGDVAKAVAPESDWTFIKRIASRVRAKRDVPKDKRSRMVGSHQLVDLGFALMDGTARQSTPRSAAMQYRDGLIIALLALVPLRRGNFTTLTLGETVIQSSEQWLIAIPADASKNHDPLEFSWPDVLVSPLQTYLDIHRPVLSRQVNRWTAPIGTRLWVSSQGSPLTEMALYQAISGRTKEAFGTPINPHLFRDEAATTMAIHDPEHVRNAAALLGHRQFATTERYYQQAQALEASREYSKVVSTHRSNGNDREDRS
jgi:integrase